MSFHLCKSCRCCKYNIDLHGGGIGMKVEADLFGHMKSYCTVLLGQR